MENATHSFHPEVEGPPLGQVTALGSAGKRALLERLMAQKRVQRKIYPLSFAQSRIWFQEQLVPGTANHHILQAVSLRTRLDHELFERCWNEVVGRHDALRTRVETFEAGPAQIVDPSLKIRIAVVDLTHVRPEEREDDISAAAKRLFVEPFDLARGPLLRVTVAQLPDDESVIIVVMHHIVADNQSVHMIFGEVKALYEAAVAGSAITLSTPRIQYGEFSRWQRSLEQDAARTGQLQYWRERLAGIQPIELPADHPRLETAGAAAGRVSIFLSKEATQRIRQFQRSQGVSLFVVTLGAFQALLARLSSSADIVVGTPITGRQRADMADAVGLYMNDLVMRTDLAGDPSFASILDRVRITAAEAFANQDIPFEQLVQQLQPERDATRHPFFDILFLFLQEVTTGLPGVEPVDVGHATAKLDLSHLVVEETDHIDLIFEYNADLFDRATIERLAMQLECLLDDVCANPTRRLSEIRLAPLTPEHAPLVTHLIARQAAAHPGALALRDREGDWSYARLNGYANQIARRLRSERVGRGDIVAVCLPRRARQIASILGIVKSGAAYLPIDPEYPLERVAFMAQDARVRFVIADALPQGIAAPLFPLAGLDGEREDDLPLDTKPGELLYVIYTSGSTGRPKGVMITHANMSNQVRWFWENYGVQESDRGSCLAGLGFDAAAWEIWPYLAGGASIAIPDEETRHDPERLQAWLTIQHVTVAFAPTPLAERLLDLPWPEGGPLRTLITGGDRLTRRPRADLGFVLWNNYGPTETTIVATSCVVDPLGAGLPSIGTPAAHAECHVLGEHMHPAPAGVTGDLYIGGPCVGRGYLNRPGLTAERFVPDPFVSGGRLYRTGDLVKQLATGRRRSWNCRRCR
jgi:amino acid adenylation domain-containing protein